LLFESTLQRRVKRAATTNLSWSVSHKLTVRRRKIRNRRDHAQTDLARQVLPQIQKKLTTLFAQLLLPGRNQKPATIRTSLNMASKGCRHGLVPTRV